MTRRPSPFGGYVEILPATAARPDHAVWCHLDDGRHVAWTEVPTGAIAIDAERVGVVAPTALRRVAGAGATTRQALQAWTRLEVEAKLSDVPVVQLVHDPGRRVDDVDVAHLEVEDVVVTVGRQATSHGGA